ncbi:MAG: prolyl oligopeptidase family serine peptidase [Acidobacteriota bacterium]|nr:prolyl oligopeptidase family serine peptidase [Acidobacteriota bacterium]
MKFHLAVHHLCITLIAAVLFSAAALAQNHSSASSTMNIPKPPATKQQPVTDDYFGHRVVDPYRWLEDGSTPETQQWVAEQLAYTRSILDKLPGREKLHARIEQLLEIGNLGETQVGGNYYFHTRRDGKQNQPVLYVRKGVDSKDSPLVDANQLSKDGTLALDWWQVSHDGKFVAFGTSQSGSEMSTLRVITTATQELLPDTIERTRGASIAWKHENSGFYYTRYPRPGEVAAGQEMYNRHVFYHALGSDPAKDPLIFGEGRDPQDWPAVFLSDDGRWLAIMVEHGWTKTEVFLKDLQANSAPLPITSGKDFLYFVQPYKGNLYILTNEDSPHFRVFQAPLTAPSREHWREIIPQSDAVLKELHIIGGQLFALYEHNAHSLLKRFATDGKPLGEIPLPTLGTISDIGGDYDSTTAFYLFSSFTVPTTIYRFDISATKSSVWDEVTTGLDTSQYETRQVWYNSKDGTRVPMFLVMRKGLKPTGHTPVLLTAYGGFNVSLTPEFSKTIFPWLDHDGIFAMANLRGGSEFGEDWHRAGMLEKRQNVFDDFIAAAEYLEKSSYTDKQHLAIRGGSNGGLLMGAAITQRPDLFRAVICQVPLLDMLRYQNFQIAKLWIPEYGSSEDPKQFPWLYAYSPYHHVTTGTDYPAILFMTADTDTRVDPMHAKKMTPLLQAYTDGPNPVLLRIEPKAGHGAGKPISKQVEEWTDIYSFLFWQLGIK